MVQAIDASHGLLRWTLLAAIALTIHAPCLAQGGYRKHDDEARGFRLKVPRFLDEQPLEPLEEQILAKFSGKEEAKWKGAKREMDLTLLVVRIKKPPAKAADAGGERDKTPQPALSLQEQKRRELNGGTTIEEFLKRHSFVSQKRLQNALTKPVKSWAGEPFDVYEVSSANSAELVVRAFTVDGPRDIFGLFAIGYVEAFEAQILTAAKSLERFAATATDSAEGVAGFYEGTAFTDVARREKVRRALIDGWEAHDTDNFILVTNVRSKRLIQDMLADLETMRVAFTARFPPIEPLTAVSTVRVCASYEDYRAYGGPEGTGGYWQPLDEELVLFDPDKAVPDSKPWLKKLDAKAILYHEAMHQYLHYANGHVPPASWFNEGYGEYFGGAVVNRAKKEITRFDRNKFRLAWIKANITRGGWPGLQEIVRMPQGEFYEPGSAMQNYAMAWSFCYFLEQEGEKKPEEQNKVWALIPSTYVQNLRIASQDRLAKMPKDAPKDWVMQFKDEIQEEAYHLTFDNVDLVELKNAWVETMKKW